MPNGNIIVTDERGTRVITLRRPGKKNAITQDMYREMSRAIDTAQNNPDIRCMIITGGSGVFTAGDDIDDFFHADTARPETLSDGAKFLYSLALNVKPVDNKDLSVYKNGDQSGTPEAFKAYTIAGATGGGGASPGGRCGG